MKIYYESSSHEIFDMSDFPVVIEDITSLFEKKWNHDVTENMAKNKSKLNRYYKTDMSIKLTLSVFADSAAEYDEIMDRFERLTEQDIVYGMPGKLWVDDYYIEAYIETESPKEYEELFYSVDNDITIYSTYPFWIYKRTCRFEITEATSTNNKRYGGKYSYRYANSTKHRYVINGNYLESNFRLIIYGPVVNPQVIIGGQSYLVNIILEDGERLEIDSREDKVIKITNYRQEVHAFHNRRKKGYFFKKLAPGRLELMWPGTFRFDLIIYEERSVPKWNLSQRT